MTQRGTELFARAAQIDIAHMPYRGAAAAMTQASVGAGPAKRFEEQGVDIDLADAAELTDMVHKETAAWGQVIREANIQFNREPVNL